MSQSNSGSKKSAVQKRLLDGEEESEGGDTDTFRKNHKSSKGESSGREAFRDKGRDDREAGGRQSSLAAKFRAVGRFFTRNRSSLKESITEVIEEHDEEEKVNVEVKKLIDNILNIEDLTIDDIMTPRTDVVAVSKDVKLKDLKEVIEDKEHTRVPIYENSLDEVIGFVHSKDLVKFLGSSNKKFKLSDIIRKILYVPHSMRVIDLLIKMRSSGVHIAIVLDEYGGTDGLVTIEDAMEEIVGEIEDEYDISRDNIEKMINKIDDRTVEVSGRVEIEDIEEALNIEIEDEDDDNDFDTIGGLAFAVAGKVPEAGETLKHKSGIKMEIIEADSRSVKRLKVKRIKNHK